MLTKLIMKTSTTWQLLNSKLVNSNKLRGASSISTRYFLCSKHNNSYKFKGTLYTTLLTLFYTHLLHRICLLKLANNYHHNQWAYNAWIIFILYLFKMTNNSVFELSNLALRHCCIIYLIDDKLIRTFISLQNTLNHHHFICHYKNDKIIFKRPHHKRYFKHIFKAGTLHANWISDGHLQASFFFAVVQNITQ